MPRTPHLLNPNATVKVITYNDSLKEDRAFRRRVLASARTVTKLSFERTHGVPSRELSTASTGTSAGVLTAFEQ